MNESQFAIAKVHLKTVIKWVIYLASPGLEQAEYPTVLIVVLDKAYLLDR
jgi:methyl coenzyme M reductase subunit C